MLWERGTALSVEGAGLKSASQGQYEIQPTGTAGNRYHWQDKDDAPPVERAQMGLLGTLAPAIVTYGSGASAKWDFAAYALVNQPVGITATETPEATAMRAVEILESGGKVFVDSGAFGAFRSKRVLDFEREVFPLDERLVDGMKGKGDLLLVAPDVVGHHAGPGVDVAVSAGTPEKRVDSGNAHASLSGQPLAQGLNRTPLAIGQALKVNVRLCNIEA